MKFQLFNEEKMIPAFGKRLHNAVVESLKACTYNSADRYKINVGGYDFINVPNVQGHSGCMFQFVVFGQANEVITLGYYSTINSCRQ